MATIRVTVAMLDAEYLLDHRWAVGLSSPVPHGPDPCVGGLSHGPRRNACQRVQRHLRRPGLTASVEVPPPQTATRAVIRRLQTISRMARLRTRESSGTVCQVAVARR